MRWSAGCKKAYPVNDMVPQTAALETAARAALECWNGTFSQIRLLKFRENAVFSATRDDGVRVALRLHRPDYHRDGAIESELTWMSALAAAGFHVPEAVPACNGRPIIHVAHPLLPDLYQADLLTWIDGRAVGTVGDPLPDADQIMSHFRNLGAMVAALHNHAESWERPEGFERKAWDSDALVGAEPIWGRFWEFPELEADERSLLMAARDKAVRELAALGTSPDRYGLIHADLIPDNILCENGRLALIDFDDCGDGWHLFDIATILFVHFSDPGFPLARDALIAGYVSVRPRRDDIIRQLDLFLFLRSTTYLGWLQTRSDNKLEDEVVVFLTQSCLSLARAYVSQS
jgi:Ser/Thr protein kinase RdoA (MazF antagonist)